MPSYNIIDAACRIDYEYKELQKDCNDLKRQLAEAKAEVAALALLLKQAGNAPFQHGTAIASIQRPCTHS